MIIIIIFTKVYYVRHHGSFYVFVSNFLPKLCFFNPWKKINVPAFSTKLHSDDHDILNLIYLVHLLRYTTYYILVYLLIVPHLQSAYYILYNLLLLMKKPHKRGWDIVAAFMWYTQPLRRVIKQPQLLPTNHMDHYALI